MCERRAIEDAWLEPLADFLRDGGLARRGRTRAEAAAMVLDAGAVALALDFRLSGMGDRRLFLTALSFLAVLCSRRIAVELPLTDVFAAVGDVVRDLRNDVDRILRGLYDRR
jgi:hypothetical protein